MMIVALLNDSYEPVISEMAPHSLPCISGLDANPAINLAHTCSVMYRVVMEFMSRSEWRSSNMMNLAISLAHCPI